MTQESNSSETIQDQAQRISDEVRTRVEAATARVCDPAGELFGSLERIGRLWAAHGLDIGRTALEQTSSALQSTAEELRKVSDAIDVKEDAEKA